jgi:S1-C subfamily serine protease
MHIDINYLDVLIKEAQSTGKIEDPIKKIIKKGLQSSCSLYVRASGKEQWSGSGFHIGNGYIITAGHVVPNEKQLTEINVTFDNQTFYSGEKIASDENIDCGIVYCKDIIDAIPFLSLGDSDTLEIGDIIAIIGSPEGFHDTATVGRVSNIHQSVQDENLPAWQDIIFVDADILEGSSGGMVIGTDGLVYGLVMGVTGQHAEYGVGESSISPSNKIKQLFSQIV